MCEVAIGKIGVCMLPFMLVGIVYSLTKKSPDLFLVPFLITVVISRLSYGMVERASEHCAS